MVLGPMEETDGQMQGHDSSQNTVVNAKLKRVFFQLIFPVMQVIFAF